MATKVDQLRPSELNPRRISDDRLDALRESMEEFGDLSGVVFNRTTKRLVGGHQRVTHIPADAEITLEKKLSRPSKRGSVAFGFIEFGGERFAYREVKWTEEREKLANIAANKHGGDWDYEMLTSILADLSEFEDLDLTLSGYDHYELDDLLAGGGWPDGMEGGASGAGADGLYTTKIESPVYEPKSEVAPDPLELYDDTRTRRLLQEISETEGLDPDLELFLRAAATRHTVFRYDRIAEFYAHAPANVQRLMEESALIIIDYDRAVELGFVRLNAAIDAAWADEVAEAEEQEDA